MLLADEQQGLHEIEVIPVVKARLSGLKFCKYVKTGQKGRWSGSRPGVRQNVEHSMCCVCQFFPTLHTLWNMQEIFRLAGCWVGLQEGTL